MAVATDADTAAVPSRDDILARAEALVPVLHERAGATEKARRLSDDTMRDLFDAGLLRILQPARYGGYAMDWPMHMEAARILARGCASTAWIVAVVGAHSAIAGRLSQKCQDDIWGETQDMLIATASARTTGTIVKVEGGYRLNGEWRFASGIDNSGWVMVTGPLDEDAAVTGSGIGAPPGFLRVLMPTSDIEIVDTWFVSGMAGTGSKNVNCDDLFVPDYRVMSAPATFGANPPGAAVNPHYLFQVEFMPYFGSSLLGPMLGVAEGAYEDYRSITSKRMSALFRTSVADQAPVQQRLAESAAEIKAAHLMLEAKNQQLHERGLAHENFSADEKLEHGRDNAYIAKLCVSSVTRLVSQMGALGIFDDNPVQRHFRDVTAMATQIAVNWDRHMTLWGKQELGLGTGDSRAEGMREQPG